MAGVNKVPVVVDVADRAPAGCRSIAADLFVPDQATASGFLWCCVPGGGISRAYFDLEVPEAADSYSMARFAAERGHVVLTIDPPGVGGSDSPTDGYDLTPQRVAGVLDLVVSEMLDRLSRGQVPGVSPGPRLEAIGVGHSAGACLVACQQAWHRSFGALALLGFSNSGLPFVLTEDEAACTDRPEALVAALPDLVRARFGGPLPEGTSADSDMLLVGAHSSEAKAAAARASSRLLGLVGLTCLVPGSIKPQLDQVDVPTFVAVGEHDIAGPTSALPGQLPACHDLTLVTLPGVGHNHNVTDSRLELWDRLVRWVTALPHDRAPSGAGG
ncbi:MAG TPA: alpha/beta hydrolase [Acidimicrobiales bacterium]|jgi:pimeloyl-ACP methyl ester carboxylesterase|nr:alpha/beta hydrolase [Acidimicrobiales bacterium]